MDSIDDLAAPPEARRTAALLRAASDFATSPERLRQIVDLVGIRAGESGFASTHRREILEAVASHPNTPLEVLARLIATLPDAVSANPILPLLPLEAPDFVERIGEQELRSLLRRANLPIALIGLIAMNTRWPELAEEARLHVMFAGEVSGEEWLTLTQKYVYEHTRQATGQNQMLLWEIREFGFLPLDSSWAEILAKLPGPPEPGPLEDPYLSLRNQAGPPLSDVMDHARDPQTPVEEVQQYLHDPRFLVRCAAFCHPSQPPEQLMSKGGEWGWAAAVRNPRTDASLLRRLVRSHNPEIRWAALRHPAAPPNLRDDCRREIRLRVAHRERGYWPVHLAVLRNMAGTDQGISAARRAAQEERWQVRLAAALVLPPTEERLLRELQNDGNRLVRAAAHARLADPQREFAL